MTTTRKTASNIRRITNTITGEVYTVPVYRIGDYAILEGVPNKYEDKLYTLIVYKNKVVGVAKYVGNKLMVSDLAYSPNVFGYTQSAVGKFSPTRVISWLNNPRDFPGIHVMFMDGSYSMFPEPIMRYLRR